MEQNSAQVGSVYKEIVGYDPFEEHDETITKDAVVDMLTAYLTELSDADLESEIQHRQRIQMQHGPDTPESKQASLGLQWLFAEAARRPEGAIKSL